MSRGLQTIGICTRDWFVVCWLTGKPSAGEVGLRTMTANSGILRLPPFGHTWVGAWPTDMTISAWERAQCVGRRCMVGGVKLLGMFIRLCVLRCAWTVRRFLAVSLFCILLWLSVP